MTERGTTPRADAPQPAPDNRVCVICDGGSGNDCACSCGFQKWEAAPKGDLVKEERTMTEEPWNEHTPGDPMPCKCGDSVVEVELRSGTTDTDVAKYWIWGEDKGFPSAEITAWRFVTRKGEDVIAADPYDALKWDEDDTATVALEKPGLPEWVRDGDLVRFSREAAFSRASFWVGPWKKSLAFQIERRPVLTPAVPQVLEMLSVATDDEADVIRSAARRANIEVPE